MFVLFVAGFIVIFAFRSALCFLWTTVAFLCAFVCFPRFPLLCVAVHCFVLLRALLSGLQGRHRHTRQDGDDRDDDQQLNQREALLVHSFSFHGCGLGYAPRFFIRVCLYFA